MTNFSARAARAAGLLLLVLAMGMSGCFLRTRGPGLLIVGVSYSELKTSYAVAQFEALNAELRKQEAKVFGAIADGDANKQLEQVRNFVTRRARGIIVAPHDAATAAQIERIAGDARIPVVFVKEGGSAPLDPAAEAALQDESVALVRALIERITGKKPVTTP